MSHPGTGKFGIQWEKLPGTKAASSYRVLTVEAMQRIGDTTILAVWPLINGQTFAVGGDFKLTADDCAAYSLTDSHGRSTPMCS